VDFCFYLYNPDRSFCTVDIFALYRSILACWKWIAGGNGWGKISQNCTRACIITQGWGQWELRPGGQLVSGIAAVFYVIIYPAPWSVLPVNAILNASASVCFYFIHLRLIENRKISTISTLPFIFFPSALLWNTQFHNENYAIPGVVFILYGWMSIAKKNKENQKEKYFDEIISIVTILGGSLLLGLDREYIFSGITFLCVLAGIGLCIYWLINKSKVRDSFTNILLIGLAGVIMIFEVHLFGIYTGNIGIDGQNIGNANSRPRNQHWVSVTWLPNLVDNQFENLAKYRNRFVKAWNHAGSGIDMDVTFNNVGDMIKYIPRAVEIAFLSPFPNTWFSEGKKITGNAMRAESAFEMVFVYFCFIGLPVFIWNQRVNPAVWFILFVCISMGIVYAMIVPNLGALYRFRYPYFMPLVSLGLAGWIKQDSGIVSLRKE
jgi:hypothetical protein